MDIGLRTLDIGQEFMKPEIIFWILGTYGIASFPTGFVLVKLLKGIDIRKLGSGNTGATNVFRAAGAGAFAVTLMLDAFKGYLPVMLAARYFTQAGAFSILLIALTALCGHIFSIFLKFRGGKGVATAAGVFLALLPAPAGLAIASFMIIFVLTRYVSAGSLAGAVVLPLSSWLLREHPSFSVFATLAGLLIVYTHRANIKRLLNGTENKISFTSSKGK